MTLSDAFGIPLIDKNIYSNIIFVIEVNDKKHLTLLRVQPLFAEKDRNL